MSAIFEQSCLICHGEHGPYTEELIIQSRQELVDTGTVIPGNPDGSIFYQRLIETAIEKRMPLGQPPLPPEAIQTIRQWIQAGAPDWNTSARTDINFITTEEMLQTIENHVQSLDTFDRAFARYFTSTHLYNAGETTETLRAYQRALSKLVNSLSWGREVTKPQPIDSEATIFYIDLRDYEWELGTNRWTLIETEYPYNIAFEAPTQTALREKLTNLRQEMSCEVPFVHVDWFLATASLPPLYHDILDLPLTDRELEAELDVDVGENIINAAGKRVWRAGFNDSRVSSHNRIVERHRSRYGAYWKSYDFAGSVGSKNVLTHPLNFTHDGGEIIFNLPNGLQAYYLVDASGNRLDAAPPEIVQNPATSDSTVRNGLSCIGCHTEGMKTFEDQVRGVAEQSEDPPFDKDKVLRLYVEKTVMDALVEEDTEHYRQALEATGDIFGGIEPVQRFHEAFQAPLDASHAAAAVGLEAEIFLGRIRENTSLQNLGLLVLENGTIKRDTWTEQFHEVVFALDAPEKSQEIPVEQQTERIPGDSVHIPDPNLRAVIAEFLDKAPDAPITAEEMATLTGLTASGKRIQNLEGIQFATGLEWLYLSNVVFYGVSLTDLLTDKHKLGDNNFLDLSPLAGLTQLKELDLRDSTKTLSDLSPLAGLTQLTHLYLDSDSLSDLSPLAELTQLTHLHLRAEGDINNDDNLSDISPLAGLTQLETLSLNGNKISDISPLAGLTQLRNLNLYRNNITDLSSLAELTELTHLNLDGNDISDFSPLVGLTKLERLVFDVVYDNLSTLPESIAKLQESLYFSQHDPPISDLSPLARFTGLRILYLNGNNISDISPLSGLTKLEHLGLEKNNISDISPLAGLTELSTLNLDNNNISDVSPLAELTGLRDLSLRGNNISDISPLKALIERPVNFFWYNNPGFPEGGPKIEGPWLWVAVQEHLDRWRHGEDILALASDNAVTELGIATTGATVGSPVGENVWTPHKMEGHRIGTSLAAATGMEGTFVYGCIFVNSPRHQETTLFVPDGYRIKVWFNGVLLHHSWRTRSGGPDYVDFVPVTLKAGKNVLLFGASNRGDSDGSFGFAPGTEYTTSIRGMEYTFSHPEIYIGDTFTLDLSARNVIDLAGWQFDIAFDPAVLEVVEVNEGDFLKEGGGATFFQKGTINNTTGKITKLSSARLNDDGVNGTGTLLSVTFTAKTAGETRLSLDNFQLGSITGEIINAGPHAVVFTIEGQLAIGDVNRDGQVSVLDLILVARHLGGDTSANPQADVNRDGIINIQDLILVAQHLGESTASAAPSVIAINNGELTPTMVQAWITQAQIEDDGSIAFQQGIATLERLLTLFIPKETALLHNYPNPFNPETWIPYQLAEPAEVTLRIYAVNGTLVRTLALGHQPAGIYQTHTRAAYWDGKNQVGESVASGIYFYTLTAGDFNATRKMLIRK